MKGIVFSDKAKKITFFSALVAAVAAYILMSFTPLGLLGLKKEGGQMFDTMVLYGTEKVYGILDGTSQAGMKLYIQMHVFDYIFMTALFVVEFLAMGYLLKKFGIQRLKILYVFSIGEFVCDVFEDVFLDVMVSVYPTQSKALVIFANLSTLGKWYFTIGFLVTVITILIMYLRKKKALPTGAPTVQSVSEKAEGDDAPTDNKVE